MMESKVLKLSSDRMYREEAIVYEYSCFGWNLMQKDVVTEDGKRVQVILTFTRDTNIPNRQILNELYAKYTVEETKIERAGRSAGISLKAYMIVFSIITAIACVILFTTFYPYVMDILWRPDLFTRILIIFLTLVLGGCAGGLLGVVPMGIYSAIQRQKAEDSASGSVYATMRYIANQASQYL